MSRRKTSISVAIAILIMVGGDLLARRISLNSVPRQRISLITSAPDPVDVLAIGNSLVQSGFDRNTFQQVCREEDRPCVAVNGGVGATGTIEHLILSRLAFSRHHVRTVMYGFFDSQLSDDPPLKNADILGNHNMLYYQEPAVTLQYAQFDRVNRIAFEVFRRSALLRERSSIWARVERFRRQLESFGMPAQETNEFGRKSDFALLEAADTNAFNSRCEEIVESGKFLSPPIEALLDEARQHGTRVIFVEMPMHPSHLQRFYSQPVWESFRAKTRAAVEAEGARYLDASGWVRESKLFEDPLHLSGEGAKEFSRRLAGYWLDHPAVSGAREP
jgi:hypothetical protein